MNVANASLSQMPFHHFIVTRSPNHMWAISWAIDVGHALQLGLGRRVAGSTSSSASRNVTQPRFSIAPNGEVGHGDEVELVAGIGDAEVVGEEVAARTRRPRGRTPVRCALAGRVDDPQRRAVDVDRLGDLERADDERDEVGRHRHGVGEADRAARPSPVGSSAICSPRWRRAARSPATTSVTAKIALQVGLVPAGERPAGVGRLELGGGDDRARCRRRP